MGRLQPTTDNYWQQNIKLEKSPLSTPAEETSARERAPRQGSSDILHGGLLGESERKNLYKMASDAVGVTYHKLQVFEKKKKEEAKPDNQSTAA